MLNLAIKLPNLELLPSEPHRDLVKALHELYDEAGRPPSREISKYTYQRRQPEGDQLDTVSHETVSAALGGKTIPAWAKVKSIVTALVAKSVKEQDVEEWLREIHQLWIKAQPGSRPREPAGRPVLPLPERNPHFTGREMLLDAMHRRLSEAPNAPLLLSGAPGVGKTQLALEYAHRHAKQYSAVWWLPADQSERARDTLAHGRCLLVLDNAEADDLHGGLPATRGEVIVTSRDPGWGGHTGLEVPDFDRAESIQFLCRRDSGITGDLADEIIRRFGRLPLRLHQITALPSAIDLSWTDLLDELDGPGQPDTAVAALHQVLDRLRAENRLRR
ncbi:hypothetical protein [Actinoplanes sp. NPDC049599]|uniref:hypothetical protein n=1 Tax=Actinoplanes sp. NPDC049599 TaxID=3363903 RepID=UPI0037911D81